MHSFQDISHFEYYMTDCTLEGGGTKQESLQLDRTQTYYHISISFLISYVSYFIRHYGPSNNWLFFSGEMHPVLAS